MTYTLTVDGVQRADGAVLADAGTRLVHTRDDDGNIIATQEVYNSSDWAEYQEWLKVPGNVPAPYVPPVIEPPVQGLTATEVARLRAFLATQP